MVKSVETGVEVKKLESQGRIILPADWRAAEMMKLKKYTSSKKGYLKLVPKRKGRLTAASTKLT
jgi:hypothetical protein